MGIKHIDDEGKTVVNTAGAGSGEPPNDWYLNMIARFESLRRAMVVANYIEPVRLRINDTVAIEERHFNPIVWQSAFVPRLQAPLYALGFARFFQGDFLSAAHLLIPQLEPSLRHILKAHGADPTKRRDDATEEDRSLDAIIGNHRAELVSILGAPLLEELDRVFNIHPGPALRHDVAHGQLSAGQCYSPDVTRLLAAVSCLLSVLGGKVGRMGTTGPGDRGARSLIDPAYAAGRSHWVVQLRLHLTKLSSAVLRDTLHRRRKPRKPFHDPLDSLDS